MPTRNRTRRLFAGALLTGSLSLGVAAPALAQQTDPGSGVGAEAGSSRLQELKDRCLAEIARRQATLVGLESTIAGSAVLTDAHQASLQGIVDGTQGGLDGLAAQIGAGTTAADVRGLCEKVATDHRVFLVVVPQVHLTIGADQTVAAGAATDAAVAQLDAAIAAAAGAGIDVTEAQGHRDAAVAAADDAEAATAGTADAVLAVTPASYNAGPGKTTLDDARADLRSARTDLGIARTSLAAAAVALRQATGA